MLGGEDASPDRLAPSAGIVPRISRELFALLDAERQHQPSSSQVLVSCSFMEIYNEVLYDLGEPAGGGAPSSASGAARGAMRQLEIRESATGGVRVHGLTQTPVASERDILRLVASGHRRRATGSTAMNLRSSRSHAVFSLDILRRKPDGGELRARVSLVDLAGSERTGQFGAKGEQFKEGVAINKSLSALGAVINALAAQGAQASSSSASAAFVPYRNSKLTRVLQGSLGGNSLTAMVATVALDPSCVDDNVSTLQYAERAKLIPVHAVANEGGARRSGAADGVAQALRAQVRQLQVELAALVQRGGRGAEAGEDDAFSRELRQRLDEAHYELTQTWEEKERFVRELRHSQAAAAGEREVARVARGRERERARARLQAERVHGQWVRVLALSESLWARVLPQLLRTAGEVQLSLSEAELRFCQQRSFASMMVSALAEQAAELHQLELERRRCDEQRLYFASGGSAGGGGDGDAGRRGTLTVEHSMLHSLRQVGLKLHSLHAEGAKGAQLREAAELGYAHVAELLEQASAQLQRASSALLQLVRSPSADEPSAGVPADVLAELDAAEADEETRAQAEVFAEGLLDIECARAQLEAWSAQLLSPAQFVSQLVSALSELAAVLGASLRAHAQREARAGASSAAQQPSGRAADAARQRADELSGAIELEAALRSELAELAGAPREGGAATERHAGPALWQGGVSAAIFESGLRLVHSLEAALAHRLRAASASSELAMADGGSGAPQPSGLPSRLGLLQSPASRTTATTAAAERAPLPLLLEGSASSSSPASSSAAERRAARHRQRATSEQGALAPPALRSDSESSERTRSPRPASRPLSPAAAGSPGEGSRRLASESGLSERGSEVAELEERLSQATRRLRASEEALQQATGASRELAACLADADASRAALTRQIEAMALDQDDLWRQAATLRSELDETRDKEMRFLEWLQLSDENLPDGQASAEDKVYSNALHDAYKLVNEMYRRMLSH